MSRRGTRRGWDASRLHLVIHGSILALAIALAVWILWAERRNPLHTGRFEVWYVDRASLFLVPAWRQVDRQVARAAPALASVALDLLGQAPAGLVSPLPAGGSAHFLFSRGKEAVARVRLPGSLGAGGERLLVGAVARTLLALPHVDQVRVWLTDRRNRPLATHIDVSRPFDRHSPEVRNGWEGRADGPLVTAWFRLEGTTYLVPLDLDSPVADRPLLGTLRALAATPPRGASGLVPAVPASARLRLLPGEAAAPLGVLWTHPDEPPDPDGQRRLVVATVLSLTERQPGRKVRFVSPAGTLYRRLGDLHLTWPLSREDCLPVR